MYTDLLKKIWDSLYDPKIETVETVEKFFHQDYEQCINGVSLNRAKYIHHILEQKRNMTIDTIDYKHILEKENEVFAIYYPKGRNTNNLPIEAEVIAYFRFENQKIFRIHGQVRLIKGDLADVDMKNS
jgi:hypothetical protein